MLYRQDGERTWVLVDGANESYAWIPIKLLDEPDDVRAWLEEFGRIATTTTVD